MFIARLLVVIGALNWGLIGLFGFDLVAFLFGGLQVGGYTVQATGVPATTVSMLQGLLLFFVLGGELFYRYRLTWRNKVIKEGAN